MWYLYTIISILVIVTLLVLFIIAFRAVVARKKTMASMQRRLGPNIVGYYGLLQAFADAFKLLSKEYVSPTIVKIKSFNFLSILITGLAVTITVCLLVCPNKAIVAFFANHLGYPSLIYINAILWIWPVIILRSCIQDKSLKFNWQIFLIPFTIIIFIWIINSLGYLSNNNAEDASFIAALIPWNDIITFHATGNYQMATLGGPSAPLNSEKFTSKLDLTSSFMDASEASGSSSKSDTGSGSTKANLSAISNPHMLAAKDLLGMLDNLKANIDYHDKQCGKAQEFVKEAFTYHKKLEDIEPPIRVRPLLELTYSIRDWRNEVSSAKKVYEIATNIVNPAIEKKKGISEKVYLSLSRKGNETLGSLAKYNDFSKEGGSYDKCYIFYQQAKVKYGER